MRKRADCNAWTWEINRYAEIERFVDHIGINRETSKIFHEHKPEKQKRMWGVVEYDPIVSIEEGEEQHVYDLTVEHLHNFVANDIIAHNTDFSQLASNLYNVIPQATSLGVGFGDVAAAMATITAQGVPTSSAANQLRQMMIELSRAGSGAADVFSEMAGQTFAEFIAEGNNVQDALILMERAADESGLSLSDMFGSVEAGNAALALTGAGAESFADNIAEMANAAGATENAFNTMDQGIGRAMDRLSAKFNVLQIQLGERLAPIAEYVINLLGGILDAASASLEGGFLGELVDVFDIVFRTAMGFFRNLRDLGIRDAITSLFSGIREGETHGLLYFCNLG